MKLYQKLISLLVAAVMAAVLMPVCMAAPGDSVETRINNALAQRTGAELYQEIVTTAPDGTAQTMIAARSNGNAYIKMDMGDAGSLVYILKDGQGYLVDDASRMAVKGEVPTVSASEAVSADKGEAQEIPCTVTTVNVNGTARPCPTLSPMPTARRPPFPTAWSAMTSSMSLPMLPRAAPLWNTASRAPLWTRISSTSLRIIRS